MADRPGYVIDGTFYPQPEGFRLGDPVLVTEVTGMDFPSFAQALDDDTRGNDPVLLLGMIAVAIWQANPRWKRDRVARYVETIPMDTVRFEGGDEGPEVADVGPPEDAAAPSGGNSESTASSSQTSPDASSDPSNPT